MKICFILPQIQRKPIGGYKMVFEYANRISNQGHEVALLFINDKAFKRFNTLEFVRKVACSIMTAIEPRWFQLEENVKKISSTKPNIKRIINQYDLAIATGADTVEKTLDLFCGKRIAYFIQDYECWVSPEESLNKSFALGMDNIVISNWLKKKVDLYGQKPSLLLRNPIDINTYKVQNSITNRKRHSIGILYHSSKHKGFNYAYDAILKLKEIYPNLTVKLFGTSQPQFLIPDWIEFKLNASQQETVEIYNNVEVFLCSTIREGYGLTGLEAMACGAVLVSSDYDGVKEYAVDEINALLSPVGDVDGLVKNVRRLFDNDNMRIQIAENGVKSAKSFSWDKAMNILNDYISKVEKDLNHANVK